MIERVLGARRAREMQRAMRHCKVTVLCLVMTIVMLRGTIGAGKFGTPEQDFVEIRDHLYSSRKRADRVLEEVKPDASSSSGGSSSDPNNYQEFDINKLFKDEGPEEKPDPNKEYSLGPKISDWDEQRAKWLKENPRFSNFIGPEQA
ncbi:unnamed protein product [Rhodiola kirilowii]